jgi:hypothetical protein
MLRLSRVFYFNKYARIPATHFPYFAMPLPRVRFTLPRLFSRRPDRRRDCGIPGIKTSFGLTSPYHPITISDSAKPSRATGNSITLEDASSFESSARPTEQQQHATGEETQTLTFADLQALIEQGKTDGIPNNKPIPNILNVSPPLPLALIIPLRSLSATL